VAECAVEVGSACDICDYIWETVSNCVVAGSTEVTDVCGGVNAGEVCDVPLCRRGPGDSAGYCTIGCTIGGTPCPAGFTCADTGAGNDACLRD
jgi:hypothetical protein